MQKFNFIILFFMFACSSVVFPQALFIDSGQALGESSCWSVSLIDLDGDSDPDACIDGQFWVNDGKGVFTKGDQSLGEGTAAFADLNGDGYMDAICGNRLFLSDKNRNFTKKQQFAENVMGARLLDLDGDHDTDAILYTANSDELWYNDGTGLFTNSGVSLGGWGQCGYAPGDINGDGFLDIIVSIPHTPPPEMNNDIDDVIWLGNPDGSLTPQILASPHFQTRAVILADFDGDHDPDLFIGKGYALPGGDDWCKILFNDGDGNFIDSGQKLNTGYNSPDAGAADLDNDGDLDLFIVNGMPGDSGQPNTVWLNDGSGHFSDSGLLLGNENSLALALGDIDGDGDVDAVTANVDLTDGVESARVYLNTTIVPGPPKSKALGK